MKTGGLRRLVPLATFLSFVALASTDVSRWRSDGLMAVARPVDVEVKPASDCRDGKVTVSVLHGPGYREVTRTCAEGAGIALTLEPGRPTWPFVWFRSEGFTGTVQGKSLAPGGSALVYLGDPGAAALPIAASALAALLLASFFWRAGTAASRPWVAYLTLFYLLHLLLGPHELGGNTWDYLMAFDEPSLRSDGEAYFRVLPMHVWNAIAPGRLAEFFAFQSFVLASALWLCTSYFFGLAVADVKRRARWTLAVSAFLLLNPVILSRLLLAIVVTFDIVFVAAIPLLHRCSAKASQARNRIAFAAWWTAGMLVPALVLVTRMNSIQLAAVFAGFSVLFFGKTTGRWKAALATTGFLAIAVTAAMVAHHQWARVRGYYLYTPFYEVLGVYHSYPEMRPELEWLGNYTNLPRALKGYPGGNWETALATDVYPKLNLDDARLYRDREAFLTKYRELHLRHPWKLLRVKAAHFGDTLGILSVPAWSEPHFSPVVPYWLVKGGTIDQLIRYRLVLANPTHAISPWLERLVDFSWRSPWTRHFLITPVLFLWLMGFVAVRGWKRKGENDWVYVLSFAYASLYTLSFFVATHGFITGYLAPIYCFAVPAAVSGLVRERKMDMMATRG